MSYDTPHPGIRQEGLTLVELLVALAMAAIISVALIAIFTNYSRTQSAQENVIAMQQNLRSALHLMGEDLRMTGYRGPSPSGVPAAGVTMATANSISVSYLNDDTGNLTTITYALNTANNAITRKEIENGTTIMDTIVVAENIEALEFCYHPSDGSSCSTTPDAGDLGEIEAVDITILARTGREDQNFSNPLTYATASGVTWGAYDDGYRRRLGESFILFRNL
jgi:type IV pilus assembly protein PilW